MDDAARECKKVPIYQPVWYEIYPGTWMIVRQIIAYQYVPIPIGTSPWEGRDD